MVAIIVSIAILACIVSIAVLCHNAVPYQPSWDDDNEIENRRGQ